MKTRTDDLARQYAEAKQKYPDRKLMIVFDIDGTMLDIRHMIVHTLNSFDQSHNTRHFDKLIPEDINGYENEIYTILDQMNIAPEHQEKIVHWYNTYRWSAEGILSAHKPFSGIMSIIRWFQMQPNTFIGVNTSRPEINRLDTLRMLNKLGRLHKIRFNNSQIYMNPLGWDKNIPEIKVSGIKYFKQSGFHIVAMIDSDSKNLSSVFLNDVQQEILLLRSSEIINTEHVLNSIPSKNYRRNKVKDRMSESHVSCHTQLAWRKITNRDSLNRFLNSGIQWGGFSAYLDPISQKVILQQDSGSRNMFHKYGAFKDLQYILDLFRVLNRSVKIDLKQGGHLLDELFAILTYFEFDSSCLWFSADVDVIGQDGFRRLKRQYPTAILQCPVDKMILYLDYIPMAVDDRLKRLVDCGVNRFSIKWHSKNMRLLKSHLDDLKVDLNIDNVPDSKAFFDIAFLKPRSVTADFNFFHGPEVSTVQDGLIYQIIGGKRKKLSIGVHTKNNSYCQEVEMPAWQGERRANSKRV